MHCTYFHSEVKRQTWRNDFPFVLSHARYVNHGGFSRIGELEVGVSSGGDYGLHALIFFFVKSWTVSKQLVFDPSQTDLNRLKRQCEFIQSRAEFAQTGL